MLIKFIIAVFTIMTISQVCAAQFIESSKTVEKPSSISVSQCGKNTENPEAEEFCNSGIILTNKREYDLAIASFNKAIELAPKYADAYNHRGVAYGGKEDYSRAIIDFTKAIELAPTMEMPYLNRGSIYLFKKINYELAIIDFTKLIELNSERVTGYIPRAFAYHKIGREDLEAADLQKFEEWKETRKN